MQTDEQKRLAEWHEKFVDHGSNKEGKMKQCPKWQECGVDGCPHYGEHEWTCMCHESYCMCAGGQVECAEIVDPVPVVERKDASA